MLFSPFLKYKKGIIVTVVAVLLIISISFSFEGDMNIPYVSDFFDLITTPFYSFFSGANNWINDVVIFLVSIRDLSEENQFLKEKLQEYERMAVEKKELQKENNRLRELLEFKEREGYELKAARVIGRDPNTWNQMVKINKGKEDGIEREMPVVTDAGLVGRISSVDRKSSQVLLILDPGSAVSALDQNSRVTGIVEGSGDNSRELQLINLPKDSDISRGDTIISSGQGPVFPKGLKLGKVDNIEEESLGFTKRAIVTPSVDFKKLEEVFIII